MKGFVDKTSEQSGTILNRKNFMAMQGYTNSVTEILANGKIVQTFEKDIVETTFDADGSIVEKITTFEGEQELVLTKKTSFVNNEIREVIS